MRMSQENKQKSIGDELKGFVEFPAADEDEDIPYAIPMEGGLPIASVEEPDIDVDIPQFYRDAIKHVLGEIGPILPPENKKIEERPEQPEDKINPEFLPEPDEYEAINIMVDAMKTFGDKGEKLTENDIDKKITVNGVEMTLAEAAKRFKKYVSRLKDKVESMARLQANAQAAKDRETRYFKKEEWQRYANDLVNEAIRESVKIVNETLKTLPAVDAIAKRIGVLNERVLQQKMEALGFFKNRGGSRTGQSEIKRAEQEFRDQAVG